MPDPKQQVETLRRKLQNGEREIDDERDRELLLEFSDRMQLLRETYGHHRHVKLLRHCVRMSENASGSLGEALEDRQAAEEIVRWIHDSYDLDESPETNQNYRVALRVFGRRVTDEGVDGPESPPASIDWISSTLPNNYDPAPDPSDMLRWEEDIEPMIEAARNTRDEAAIALQFDAGLRGGELYDLRVGDLSQSPHGLVVSVDGKTGQRAVDLIPSTPHVNRWLGDHPGGDDDFLWTSLNDPNRLSYNAYLDMFKRPAKRGGVDKDVTPTALRKSNLAWLCRQGMNARHIEQRQGREHGSEAVSRYAAIFDDDVGNEYATMMGLETGTEDDDSSEFAPLTCPRCDRETPQREDRCMWCGQALSPEAADEAAEQDREMMSAIAENPELAETIMDIKDMTEDVPGVRIAFEID